MYLNFKVKKVELLSFLRQNVYASSCLVYYYYGARYYDPKRSFWLSVDPLAEITMSPYAYVWNDPVNFADPTGLMGERKGGNDLCDPLGKIVL